MAKKCVICGQPIKKEEENNCVPYKGRLAHKPCFNSAIKIIKTNKDEQIQKKQESKKSNVKNHKPIPKVELKDGLSDEEYSEKQSFYDYLKMLMGVETLSAKIYIVSEKYLSRFAEWTWKGMKDTLVYLHEVKETDLTGDIVGIIPYAYDDAQNYYEELQRLEEVNKNVDVNKLYSERIVRIKIPERHIKQLKFDD